MCGENSEGSVKNKILFLKVIPGFVYSSSALFHVMKKSISENLNLWL